MVLCLLLLPGMAGAGTGADSPEKKTASAVNNKRNVRQKITPVGTRKSTSVRPLSVCEVKVDLPTGQHAALVGRLFVAFGYGGTEG